MVYVWLHMAGCHNIHSLLHDQFPLRLLYSWCRLSVNFIHHIVDFCCAMLCYFWVINLFPSLSSYVTEHTVDAHLFLHPQGISHRENVIPVNMVKWAWRTHTRSVTHARVFIYGRISLNILLRQNISKYIWFISWKFEFVNFKWSSFIPSCHNCYSVGKAIWEDYCFILQ
jgi:hypothetical protein